MLLSCALPFESVWFISISKCKEEIFSVSEESIGAFPGFCTESTEFISKLILNYYYGVLIFLTVMKEGDQTTTIVIHAEASEPFALSVIVR